VLKSAYPKRLLFGKVGIRQKSVTAIAGSPG
jgi:hypothetical protein